MQQGLSASSTQGVQDAGSMQSAFTGPSTQAPMPVQSGFNQPAGLPGFPTSGPSAADDSNLSFFSDSQLNPGVIQPPL